MCRLCARPGCGKPAVATLAYDYRNRRVWLEELAGEPHPMTHDLCERHAGALVVPNGWAKLDQRGGTLFPTALAG